VFCESDEIPKVAAFTWCHSTTEIFTVKMISSSRLKPHWTDWRQYKLLSPPVTGDEGGTLEPGIQRHYTFQGPST